MTAKPWMKTTLALCAALSAITSAARPAKACGPIAEDAPSEDTLATRAALASVGRLPDAVRVVGVNVRNDHRHAVVTMAYAKRVEAGAVVRALQQVQVARGEDGAWRAEETVAFQPPQSCCYTPPPSPGQEAHAAARRSLGFLAETVRVGQARQEAATGDWLVPVAYDRIPASGDRWLDDKSAQTAQRTLRVRHDPKLGFRVVG